MQSKISFIVAIYKNYSIVFFQLDHLALLCFSSLKLGSLIDRLYHMISTSSFKQTMSSALFVLVNIPRQ